MKIEVSPTLAWYLIEAVDESNASPEMANEVAAFMADVRACAATPKVKGTGKATLRCYDHGGAVSHYTEDEASCRVDFWKDTGKWYATEAVVFVGGTYKGTLIHDAFREALKAAGIWGQRYSGMRATCLEPHHEHSHPISLVLP